MSETLSDLRVNGRRVLVADDDVIIRSVLRSLLTKVGQTVEQASTSDDALRLAMATPFDMLVLDIDMPSDGGLAVCRKLRHEHEQTAVPVVVLTALDNAAIRTLSAEAGANVFIAKPFNPATLMRQIVPYLDTGDADRSRLAEVLASDRDLRVQDALPPRSAGSLRRAAVPPTRIR